MVYLYKHVYNAVLTHFKAINHAFVYIIYMYGIKRMEELLTFSPNSQVCLQPIQIKQLVIVKYMYDDLCYN